MRVPSSPTFYYPRDTLTAILVCDEGLRHAAAGEILGVSEATVSWRMHELRKRLRAMAAGEAKAVP